MKNIIRKILKEEFDSDWDWAEDVETCYDVYTYFLEFTVPWIKKEVWVRKRIF